MDVFAAVGAERESWPGHLRERAQAFERDRPAARELDAATLQAMRALGYVDSDAETDEQR